MEDTQRVNKYETNEKVPTVLILIIMEYTLRAQQKPFRLQRSYVLILTIMEYTLREVILYSTNYQHIKLIKLI